MVKKRITTYDVQPLRTNQDINDMLFFLRRNGWHAERDVMMFLFGINTGLRMSDIVVRKVGEVRGQEKLTIIEKKTQKKKVIHLGMLKERIAEYTKDMGDDDYMFPSRKNNVVSHLTVNGAYRILSGAAEKLGRTDIGTHTLRKTFGYHYYRKTHDIATLMELFNHSSERVTLRYIGITDEEVGKTLQDFQLGF